MIFPMNRSVLGIAVCVCGVLVLGISGSALLLSEVNPPVIEFNVTGLMPAALTSLNDDNSINIETIPAYVDYLTSNGIKSVLVGGSSGEHMFLNVNDRIRIIDAWVNASEGSDILIQAQIGGAPFAEVIELAKHCSSNGVNSILTLPDLYAKPKSVEELVSYVEMIAKAAPNLPVFYYHIPKKTGVSINMPEFVTSASERIPNFRGIKFTSYDLVEASLVLQTLRENQRIFLGGERLLAPAALLGIDSFTSPAINLFPGLMQNILDAIENGYVVKAREWQRKLSGIVDEISEHGGRIAAMKTAMEFLTGIKMGPPALPAKPLSHEARSNIERSLMNFKI